MKGQGFLSGAKTYLIGVAGIITGLYLLTIGRDEIGIPVLFISLSSMGLRAGIGKVEK